jgi:hypothetical protein
MQDEPLRTDYNPASSELYPETNPRKLRKAIIKSLQRQIEFVDYMLANNPPKDEIDDMNKLRAAIREGIKCL